MKSYTEEELKLLSCDVRKRLSDKRFFHIKGVERAAEYIADFCLPDGKTALRAAALLHDIAKEYSEDEILTFIKKDGILLSKSDLLSPLVLHSYAAPYVIKKDFKDFAIPEVLSACKNHTLGSPDMSIFDEIIFISDYIEEGRAYASCIKVREFLYSSFNSDDFIGNIKALHKAVLLSIEATENNLMTKGAHINETMHLTKNAFMSKI